MNRIALGEITESRIETVNSCYNGEISYIDISSIDSKRKRITNTSRLEFSTAPSRAKQLVQQGDVLVSTVRPNLNAVAIIDCSFDCVPVASTGFSILRPMAGYSSRYLFHFCQSRSFIDYLTGRSTGASYPAVNNSIVRSCTIPAYSLADQESIAAHFDRLNSLIDAFESVGEKLDRLVKSRFVEMFGSDVDSTSWSVERVERIADVTVGVVIKPAQYYVEDASQGVRAFRSLNVQQMHVKDGDWVYFSIEGHEKNGKSSLKASDVLIVRSGYPGTSCVVGTEYEGSNAIDLIIAHPDLERINPTYLAAFNNFPIGQRQIQSGVGGAAQQHFNVGRYKSLKIPVPPIELQQEFAAFVAHVDKSRSAVQRSIEQLELLKASLMQEYFG